MIYTILKYIFKVIYSIFFRARVEGIENIPVEGPVIIAANHMSNWDPMLLGTYICRISITWLRRSFSGYQ